MTISTSSWYVSMIGFMEKDKDKDDDDGDGDGDDDDDDDDDDNDTQTSIPHCTNVQTSI